MHVEQWVAAAPDRFIAAPFMLEPDTPGLATPRRAYDAGRFSGMGEIWSVALAATGALTLML